MLKAISPIDGRYAGKTAKLAGYFSEYALIRYRIKIELEYVIQLSKTQGTGVTKLQDKTDELRKIYIDFNEKDATTIKDIEKLTNHDVKAVEYFIKEKFGALGLGQYAEWIHFGLTSQDINNTATPLMLKDYLDDHYYPELEILITDIKSMAGKYEGIAMLARTHGQPASPTTLGKEFMVWVERLEEQLGLLKKLPLKAKFGGATGNFNAHKIAIPEINWPEFADKFIQSFGMSRSHYTTQIAHYDHIAAIFHNVSRINTILVDLCRDMWTYISMEYFRQKVVKGEVGSSAMPHKINPIDFENAEGNLGVANSLFEFMAAKLPVSRLQRDLTDSTVIRNTGVPFGHTTIAFQSISRGMKKLELNQQRLKDDLDKNWAVVAEAIQNILRRENYPKPYEALKELTRGNETITRESLHEFIDKLNVSDKIKVELKEISPHNYLGYY